MLYAVNLQTNVYSATVPVNHAYTDARTLRNVIGEDGDVVGWNLDLQYCILRNICKMIIGHISQLLW